MKYIHQIWINFAKSSPIPIPEKYIEWIESWKKYHPDYEYILWNDDKIETLIRESYPEYQDLYRSCLFPVQKTDIARLIILYHYGGIYTDLDTECFECFDQYLDKFVVVQSDLGLISNHFIMSPKKHPLILKCLSKIRINIKRRLWPDWLYIFNSTGPFIIHSVCNGTFPVVKLGPDSFPNRDTGKGYMAIHYSDASWLDSTWNSIIKSLRSSAMTKKK